MAHSRHSLEYRKLLENRKYLPELFVSKARWDVHAVYIPEVDVDFQKESKRLKKCMDENDCVNIFLSEVSWDDDTIVRELESQGTEVPLAMLLFRDVHKNGH